MGQTLYRSGNLHSDELATRVSLNLLSSNLDPVNAAMLAHFLETWCEHHCIGTWRVEHDYRSICVFFTLDRDMVLFKISEEYDVMQRHTL
jgi:hypothetical protein